MYELLSNVFGIGYIPLPVSLFLLAILIFRSFERQFGWIQIVSISVFLLAGLGLINLASPGEGGLLGALVSRPFSAAFDTVATVIFLIAFLIVSIIIAFDIHLGR